MFPGLSSRVTIETLPLQRWHIDRTETEVSVMGLQRFLAAPERLAVAQFRLLIIESRLVAIQIQRLAMMQRR